MANADEPIVLSERINEAIEKLCDYRITSLQRVSLAAELKLAMFLFCCDHIGHVWIPDKRDCPRCGTSYCKLYGHIFTLKSPDQCTRCGASKL